MRKVLFSEYEMANTTVNIGEKILLNTIGTVLIIYEDHWNYEVDFFNKKHESLGTYTVTESEIEKYSL